MAKHVLIIPAILTDRWSFDIILQEVTGMLSIKDWPKKDQPREKMLALGPAQLSDAEILAIFLRTGTQGKTAVDLARSLLLKFGNLRALLAYQWFFPGKKLLFMGGEIGQSSEWNENAQVEWWLLDHGPFHKGVQQMVKELNSFYCNERALFESDYDHEGFYWIDCSDSECCCASAPSLSKN